jgi:hypothetical protein
MPYPNYKKLIAEQQITGIIKVRCGCGDPATGWSIGCPHCDKCRQRDEIRVREYTRQEDRQKRRESLQDDNETVLVG